MILPWTFFVVGHNISDPAVFDYFSGPPCLEQGDDLRNGPTLLLASQNQIYLFVFPSLNTHHDVE